MADIIDRYGNYIKRIDDGILVFQFDVTYTKYTELDSSFVIYSDSAQRTLVNIVKNLVTDNTISYADIGSFEDRHGNPWNEETFRDFLDSNTGTDGVLYYANSTGWGVYGDNALTEGTPLSLTGGAAYVNLPNNAASKIETQKPVDIDTFYDESITKITGRNGDGLNITLSFAVKPTTNQVTMVTVVPDIGGAIGEIEDYARDVSFSKGQNVEQRYLSSFDVYTLDTWEANGAQLKIKADQNCEIYNVRYLLTRTHKAKPVI